MLDYKSVGKLIIAERQKLNLTQEKLGEILFVTRQAVSKWERGICMPDYDSLLKLSELFSITLDELIIGKRRKPTYKINNIMIDALKEKDKKRVVLSIFYGIILFLLLLLFLFSAIILFPIKSI